MRFKRLKLRNVRSYEDAEIEFPDGAVLLAGNVGSGKTTILLALEYALFGLQAGQRAASLLRNGAESAEVEVECEIEGKEILIERRLKREARTITSDYAALTINGVKNEYSTTELKTKILELLGYPSEFVKKTNMLYKYTVYTPQEHMKQIILEDAETRFSILRHIFGIDKYKLIRENASKALLRFKDESKTLQAEVKLIEQERSLQSAAESRISLLESSFLETMQKLQRAIEARKLTEKEIADLEVRIKEKEHLEQEIAKTKILIVSKQETLAALDRQETELRQSLTNIIPFKPEAYNEAVRSLHYCKAQRDNLEGEYIKTGAALQLLQQQKREIQARKDSVFSLEMCPTCLQDVPPAHKHNILNEAENKLSELGKKISEAEKIRAQVSSQRLIIREELELLERRKADLEIQQSREQFREQAHRKMEEINKQKITLKGDIELLLAHIDMLKTQILKLSSFDAAYKRKLEELKKAFIQEKGVEIKRAELNKELELLHKERTRLIISIKEKEKTRTHLNTLLEASDWIANHYLIMIDFIERQVMLKLRHEFSRLFSRWFQMIAGETFEIQLDENFTPLIVQSGVEMDYAFLSGGERTAVALAYRLALNQTINSLLSTIKTKDIIILDEPTEGFSEAQVDKIRDVLEQLKIKQLIIVSHEPKIEGFIDHTIRIRKDIGSSVIEPMQSVYQKP
ncbi:hypothetical protein HYZ97_00685 [Candidatus Pacearchaeota archaeon]|nr:hypothetical protein [Candidatus Pacearchaeota archaeon]